MHLQCYMVSRRQSVKGPTHFSIRIVHLVLGVVVWPNVSWVGALLRVNLATPLPLKITITMTISISHEKGH